MDKLQIVRGTYAKLIEKIDEYPEFSPIFATDRRQFYIKYKNNLQQIIGSGSTITSIVFDKVENGIHYYNAIMDDGRKISFPFEFKFDTTVISAGELIRMKADGTVEDSGIIYNEALNMYESRYDFRFPSDSIWIGEALKIGQSGGFAYNRPTTTGKTYFFLDYEDDKVSGSQIPMWYKREGLITKDIIQPEKNKLIENTNGMVIHKPSADRQVQAVYLLLQNSVNNLRMEFLVNGKPIHYYPSKLAWVGKAKGYDLTVSDPTIGTKIPLDPFFSSLTDYDISINFRADNPINLLGNDVGLPYYELDYNPIKRVNILTEENRNEFLTSDMSTVQLDSLDEKIEDTDSGKQIKMNIKDIQEVNKEVLRLKANDDTIFTSRDRGIPTIDRNKSYRQYYVTTTVLRNNQGTFLFPTVQEGATLGFENEDKTDYITLVPNTGDTIEGQSSFKADGSTFHFFVKVGTDWKMAYGGIFPNNLLSLKSTIQSLLPNELNTIDEIMAQVKNRLQIVRTVTNALSPELHTYDEIETEMTTRGFAKSLSETGITLDDGSLNVSGIDEIDVSGMEIQQVPDNTKKVKLTSRTIWETQGDASSTNISNEVVVLEPLQAYSNPNKDFSTILSLDHSQFAKAIPDGYYATLADDEEVVGDNVNKIKKGKMWFTNTVVGNGSYIQVDKAKKQIGIQEDDTLDPSLTDGTAHLIIYRIHMKGKAVENGDVDIYLKDTSGNYLLDSNNVPIHKSKSYSIGDELGAIELSVIVRAKGLKLFELGVSHTFTQDNIEITDRTNGLSCIVVQAIHKNYKTGLALIQYCIDSGQSILFDSHYNGEDIITISDYLEKDYPLSEGDVGQGTNTIDGLHLYNSTKMKVGVSNKEITFEDNGTDLCFFNFGAIISGEKTNMWKGKIIKIEADLENKEGAYYISLAKWTGQTDNYTRRIIADYTNDDIVLDSGWTIQSSISVSENVLGYHKVTGEFTIPADADNVALIIYPESKKYPSKLKMTKFKADMKVPFDYYILKENSPYIDSLYKTDTKYGRFASGVMGDNGIRYTILASETKLPWGLKKTGLVDIINDRSWNSNNYKWENEGDGLIQKDMRLTIYNIEGQVFSGATIPDGGHTLFNLYFSKKNQDGTFTRIEDSAFSKEVKKGDGGKEFKAKDFTIDVKKDDILRIFATNDLDSGCYLETTRTNESLLSFEVREEEEDNDLSTVKADLKRIDSEIIYTKEAIEKGVFLEVGIGINGAPYISPKEGGAK